MLDISIINFEKLKIIHQKSIPLRPECSWMNTKRKYI